MLPPKKSVDMLCLIPLLCCGSQQFIFGFYGRWCLQSSPDMSHIHASRVWRRWKRHIMRENCWRNKYLWSAVVVVFKWDGDDMVVPCRCCFSLWIASPSYHSDVTPGEYPNNSLQYKVVVVAWRRLVYSKSPTFQEHSWYFVFKFNLWNIFYYAGRMWIFYLV